MSIAFTLVLALGALVLLTSKWKLSPFLALILVSIGAGLAFGMPLGQVLRSVQKGVGDMLGGLVIVLTAGAMLGKLVAESGAAMVISERIMEVFGQKYLQWGLVLTGLAIGIPLFYNVGFVLALPILFTLADRYRLPLVPVAIPMLAALSVSHSLLPPHPSPTSLASSFKADIGATFLYGLIVAVPAIVVAGPMFSRVWARAGRSGPPPSAPDVAKDLPFVEAAPNFWTALVSAMLPVFLLGITALLGYFWANGPGIAQLMVFHSEPSLLMLVSLFLATFTLGTRQGKSMQEVMQVYESGARDVSMILLVIGASGALRQVLVDSQASEAITGYLKSLQLPPLLLGWLLAALIRVALGSATVAGLTAAGILAPMMPILQVNPSLMVLAVGAGSIFFSHLNDTGFWMFKTYFDVSIKTTFFSWTLMESIVSVVALLGVLTLDLML